MPSDAFWCIFDAFLRIFVHFRRLLTPFCAFSTPFDAFWCIFNAFLRILAHFRRLRGWFRFILGETVKKIINLAGELNAQDRRGTFRNRGGRGAGGGLIF